MDRSRKLVIVSHCILNTNSKVESDTTHSSMIKEVIDFIHKQNYGIIQLPCPELLHYGMKRWGHVIEQFDNPFYREKCKILLAPIVDQVKEYTACGYKVAAVIGIDYSPSCGVNITCSSELYKGELSLANSLEQLQNSITTPAKMGIFMEEFKILLDSANIRLPFVAIKENEMEKSLQLLSNLGD